MEGRSEFQLKMGLTRNALQMAKGYFHLSERALSADRYDVASMAMQNAVSMARKGKDKILEKTLKSRQKCINGLKQRWTRIKRDRETLRDDPAHSEANLNIGLYYCIWKGDWEKGIPYLAKGSDDWLQNLANSEMENTGSVEEWMGLGDGWWKKAEDARDRDVKISWLMRAARCYEEAFPKLEGLSRTKVEKRIKEAEENKRVKTSTRGDSKLLAQLLSTGTIPAGFNFLRLGTFPCGGRRNTVKIFMEEKTGLEFVLIPSGSFTRDLPPGEDNESNRQSIIVRHFLLCKTECSQEAWDKIGGHDIRQWKDPTLPIDRVDWNDCKEWCRRTALRLPSEAEWEYACRAGADTPYYFGESESDLGKHAWFSKNSDGKTHPVAEKNPNAFGLYDMYGNLWE